jgi:hypothetical protein
MPSFASPMLFAARRNNRGPLKYHRVNNGVLNALQLVKLSLFSSLTVSVRALYC